MDSTTPPRAAFVPRTTPFIPRTTASPTTPNRQSSTGISPRMSQSSSQTSTSSTTWSWSVAPRDNKKWFIVFKNEQIKARTIRLVDEEGSILGTYTRDEVLKMWEEQWLDVVQVHYDPDTMICTAKMFDRGKYQYDKKKTDSVKKKSVSKWLKEIKFNFAIWDNDLKLKIKKAKEFFADGYGVRFVTILKGRERSNPEIVLEKFKTIEKECETAGKGNGIKKEPRGYSMILMALKNK